MIQLLLVGCLGSILTQFDALDKCTILLFVYKFYFYLLVQRKPISFSSSNDSCSQQHDQDGADISEAKQQG